jgi:molecular chaperone GrpE
MNDRINGSPGSKPNPEPAPGPEPAALGAPGRPPAQTPGGRRAQERIAALDTSGATSADLLDRVELLEAQLGAAIQRADDNEAGWQRARADFANLKRRVEEERAGLAAAASDRLLGRVLELADDFDLAIEHVPDDVRGSPWMGGIEAIDRKLRALLEAEGVQAMGGEGEPFDPRTQQAISYEDATDMPDGTVMKILQRGYTIGDRVLRPALVAVARNDTDPTPGTD